MGTSFLSFFIHLIRGKDPSVSQSPPATRRTIGRNWWSGPGQQGSRVLDHSLFVNLLVRLFLLSHYSSCISSLTQTLVLWPLSPGNNSKTSEPYCESQNEFPWWFFRCFWWPHLVFFLSMFSLWQFSWVTNIVTSGKGSSVPLPFRRVLREFFEGDDDGRETMGPRSIFPLGPWSNRHDVSMSFRVGE